MIPSGFRSTTPEQLKKKYKLTEIFPGCWIMKDAYVGEYVFGAKMPYNNKDLLEEQKNSCFRCQKKLEDNPKYGSFHTAIITLTNADNSFSGMFKLPLCYSCSLIPHNYDYERL